jgi:FeS assembly SUF system protein
MSEEKTNAEQPHHVPLTVLPSSGKVDQLRKEIAAETKSGSSAAPQAAAEPQAAMTEPGAASPAQTPRQREIEIKVLGVLRTIFDPEIPVNIYDLGLIYEVKVDETDAVSVTMTLTAPGCPVAGSLPGEVEAKIEGIPEVRTADVRLVWDPPWTKDRMSEGAMLDLGFL